MSNQLETALEELLHVVHNTMVVDPMPEEGIPSWPHLGRLASLFGRLDQVKLVVAPTDVARKDMGA